MHAERRACATPMRPCAAPASGSGVVPSRGRLRSRKPWASDRGWMTPPLQADAVGIAAILSVEAFHARHQDTSLCRGHCRPLGTRFHREPPFHVAGREFPYGNPESQHQETTGLATLPRMPGMDHFGARLKHLREARGWSQEQLGFELDVTKATVSKWESGQSQPRWENLPQLQRFAAQSGLSIDYLIDGALDNTGGRANSEPPPASAGLARTTEELALLARFRTLKPARRRGLLALLSE